MLSIYKLVKYFTFFFFFDTKSLKSGVYFILTTHLKLDFKLAMVKVKCSSARTTELC